MATVFSQDLDSISKNRSLQIQDITSEPKAIYDTNDFFVSDLSTDELAQVVGGATILGGGQTGSGTYHYTVESGGHIFAVTVHVSPFDGHTLTYVKGLDFEGYF